MSSRLQALIESLAHHRVMVVGDVVLDEYLIGSASRLSREAPIPVLEFERRDLIPGGASNPAANAAMLGSATVQVGVVGDDLNAQLLRDLLAEKGIDTAGLVVDAGRQTTTKTRIMAQMGLRFPQQVARLDRIDRHAVNGEVECAVVTRIEALAKSVESIMASDYLNGLLTPGVVAAIRECCLANRLLAAADAQGDLDKYRGFDILKCNADEAARYVGRPLQSDADFAEQGVIIAERLGIRPGGAMLITRGPEGITVISPGVPATHIPALHIEDVYDTVGAGDTVLAVVTLAMLSKATPTEAAALANLAAGIVVRKVGNYTPTLDELLVALADSGG